MTKRKRIISRVINKPMAARKLKPTALIKLVNELQKMCFFNETIKEWEDDKEHEDSGMTFCEEVQELLEAYGLAPEPEWV